ncbi:YfgJ family double zinc ribbon protein [Zophobihabitans entericus]|uniref:Primosomal protein N' (Replication factor Y)-superfamily II helicase n=1 Tax=Zophobihabitans entericus TaxID=1635327 RepID=A0A6G9IA93_9GAMM|nr:zinc-ribbon domain-containing protein [Zophobihabitans entericus]QIQ20749.1 primosomal protein N' (replication factor Y) - superfamily II helicase [Zophobihabitans entericus]
MSGEQQAGLCPNCHQQMKMVKIDQYHCENCLQDYSERIHCPTCGADAQCIRGCGAVNYLCPKDGLISKSKVKYYYLPTE